PISAVTSSVSIHPLSSTDRKFVTQNFLRIIMALAFLARSAPQCRLCSGRPSEPRVDPCRSWDNSSSEWLTVSSVGLPVGPRPLGRDQYKMGLPRIKQKYSVINKHKTPPVIILDIRAMC